MGVRHREPSSALSLGEGRLGPTSQAYRVSDDGGEQDGRRGPHHHPGRRQPCLPDRGLQDQWSTQAVHGPSGRVRAP